MRKVNLEILSLLLYCLLCLYATPHPTKSNETPDRKTMDILSFVIGTNGLLSFAQLACDIVKTRQEVRDLPEDMRDLIAKLMFETCKVRYWSLRAAEVDDTKHSKPDCRNEKIWNEEKTLIQQCASEIGNALEQAKRITQKYALDPYQEDVHMDNAQGPAASPSKSSTATANSKSPIGSAYSLRDGAHVFASVMASPGVPDSREVFGPNVRGMQTSSSVRSLSTRKKLAAVLKPWGVTDKKALENSIKTLSDWNTNLYSILTLSELVAVRRGARTSVVRDYFDDPQMLEWIGRAASLEDPELAKTTGLAIQVLHAGHNCPNGDCGRYNIPSSRLRMLQGQGDDEELGSFGILHQTKRTTTAAGSLGGGGGYAAKSVEVYVEWLDYSGLDHDQEQIARGRIHALCHILDTEKPNALQTLRFLGYVQNDRDTHIGIVSRVDDQRQNLVSLHSVLSTRGDKMPLGRALPFTRLTLGQRFSLALQLSNVFLELHTARWLHRGFSSYSVLLQDSSFGVDVNKTVVCGFQYARPASNAQVSLPLGHADLSQRLRYLHPDVRHGLEGSLDYPVGYTRYQAQHDVFSLGIVLLEIGFGRTLDHILEPDKFQEADSDKFVGSLRSAAKDSLAFLMGQKYADIVHHCLGGRGSHLLAPEDSSHRSNGEHDNVLELTAMLNQIVVTLEKCNRGQL